MRDSGWSVETMDERYGKDASQSVSDRQWIGEATARGDVLLCKDLALARNPLEAQTVYMTAARVFALARADTSGPQMLRCWLGNECNLVAMAERAQGPYVVAISGAGLRRVQLAYP